MLIKQHNKLFNLKFHKSVKPVYVGGKELSLFASKNFRGGNRLISLKGKLVDVSVSTLEAVQITEKKFIDTKFLVPEDFINHSCSPNAKIDVVNRWFIAIKDISKNEEITFNYLTTEWDMKKYGADFKCLCGSQNCFKHIKGFKYLSRKQKLKLKPLLSPFLFKKI